ncbi:uncharacterized protein pbxip1a isoform X1 [Syngnathus typhle]|uniref:uncharacterized protein pbxip1a isoform X1 n=1 Tax=Syngnathus typhle TaxID=161592 RepID=UPI002A6AAF57|nr:uncharacterized protein pbxip1a isoform X1 [Syngnathus typhle]
MAMSDHSSSTGSSGSSTNSWTLLSPEEVAADNAGALDDGTESLGDAPSLSEDMATVVAGEIKPSDIPVECVLSEEGHQVCQETDPEPGDGPVLCCSLQPDQLVAVDPESQAPVIHDIMTSSPSDNEHLGVAFVSSIDFGGPRDVAEPDETLQDADVAEEPDPVIPAETLSASEPPLDQDTDVNKDLSEPPVDPVPADDVIAPENIGSVQADEESPSEVEMQEEQEEETSTSHHGDGLRRRTVESGAKASDVEDEEDEDEEMEFHLPTRKEEKAWWSPNKCIMGVAVLLFLGALFLSGDFESPGVSDEKQSQKASDDQNEIGFRLNDEMSAEFEGVLDMFDTDGSKDINMKELGTVMRMLGENPLRRELSEIIKQAKDNADKLQWKKRQEPKQDGSKWRRRVWELLEKIRREISEGVERWKNKDVEKPRKDERKEKERKRRDEWETKKPQRRLDREQRRKEKPWRSHHKQHAMADFWWAQERKLRRHARHRPCGSLEDCAAEEGLFPVELPEFEELLEGYLSKLEGSPQESKDFLRRLIANFFSADVFAHNRWLFADFAEDVADILEDLADMEGTDKALEEAMEEFEREALWKFAAMEQH